MVARMRTKYISGDRYKNVHYMYINQPSNSKVCPSSKQVYVKG